jgi:hypothetical protein
MSDIVNAASRVSVVTEMKFLLMIESYAVSLPGKVALI